MAKPRSAIKRLGHTLRRLLWRRGTARHAPGAFASLDGPGAPDSEFTTDGVGYQTARQVQEHRAATELGYRLRHEQCERRAEREG
jgi:hypothetical protein